MAVLHRFYCTVKSEIFARVLFSRDLAYGEIPHKMAKSLSLTDIGKLCHTGDKLTNMCFNATICENKILTKIS